MSNNQITKEQAYAIIGKHLTGDLIEHKGHIDGIYNTWDIDEELWVASLNGNISHVGGDRKIIISKKTGEIIADAIYVE